MDRDRRTWEGRTIINKVLVVAGAIACAAAMIVFAVCLPKPLFMTPVSTVILDRNGRLLGATVAADGQWRFPESDSVPRKFVEAVTCFEDKRFFSHIGIDVLAICRAAYMNVKNGTVKSGGSTLTMQTIRMARQNRRRTIAEKMVEMVLAVRLELSTSKYDVLRLYASHAPFGGNVVGIEAAGWRYFGCDVQRLSWAESAMLAVLPNSPSLIHPGKNRELLLYKRNALLDKLHATGKLDSSAWMLAKLEPLPPKPYQLPCLAPHLRYRICKENLEPMQGDKSRVGSPARIMTTIDAALQRSVTEIVMRHSTMQTGNGVHNAAALVIENRTGTVAAYIGNVYNVNDARHGSSVDMITAPRSTGSILKPLLYAAMLQNGELVPEQLIADLPVRIGGFAPQNYSRTFEGAVRAHDALARSLNVPAVLLLHEYTVDRFYALLTNLGMTTLFRNASDYGLSLILGGAEGTLWDIAGIYAHMAGYLQKSVEQSVGGDLLPPMVHYRLHGDGQAASVKDARRYPYAPGALWLTFQAMEEVVRPEEKSVWEQFASAKRIAWKTGTSFGFRDAWAIGITPSYTVGVWVGNADGEGRACLTGIGSAAPLLFDIFDLFTKERWFACPEFDLGKIDVCSKSGFRAGGNCVETKRIAVPPAGMQSSTCPYCRLVHCDASFAYRVHSDCEKVSDMVTSPWFVLPPAMEWFYRKTHCEYRPLPPWRPDCAENAPENGGTVISIIYPPGNSSIYVPIELNGQKGRTVFEAAHRDAQAVLYWHIDNEYLGSTKNIHRMSCAPVAGKHLLTVVDGRGAMAERRFVIMR
jgi:penicillin-binding protein 1C